MKPVLSRARSCAALVACAFLVQCAPPSGVSVTNNYDQTIDRVVIKDAKGVACSLERIPPNATVKCPGNALSAGEVTYEVSAAKFKHSGLLGFVKSGGKNSGSTAGFSLEIRKDGSVSTGGTSVGFAFGSG